jgi:hypothetical protein
MSVTAAFAEKFAGVPVQSHNAINQLINQINPQILSKFQIRIERKKCYLILRHGVSSRRWNGSYDWGRRKLNDRGGNVLCGVVSGGCGLLKVKGSGEVNCGFGKQLQ